MKTLVVILALCYLAAWAQTCPKTSAIVKDWVKESAFVAKITVTSKTVKDGIVTYNFDLLRFYKTRIPVVLARSLVYRYVQIEEKCNIDLELNEDYVLGCRRVDSCHFVRDYRNLTLPEWKLLGNNDWRD